MEIINGLFWSIVYLCILDHMFLNGEITDAVIERIRWNGGKDE